MIKVVIVDDEVLARIGIQSFLEEKENINVVGCFASGAQALEYLRSNGGADILITDIEMAEMTGLEFIEIVKREHLVFGTIIISSYSDFEYARRALKLETDSYILKQEINEAELVEEIYKIYNQKKPVEYSQNETIKGIRQFAKEQEGGFLYRVGVLKTRKEYDGNGRDVTGQVNEGMLVGLLESVLNNYKNGYLFVPGQKEMFVVFKFPEDMEQETKDTILEDICYDLQQNIKLYVNRRLSIGLSKEFFDFGEILIYYEKAKKAANLQFYDEEEPLYYNEEQMTSNVPDYTFSSDSFLEDEGVHRLKEELYLFLEECKKQQVEIGRIQQSLIEKLNILVYKVLHEYSLPEELMGKWDQKFQYFQVILEAESMHVMVHKVVGIMEQLQTDLLTQLKEDEFTNVFLFVEQNIREKISLSEMAELNCMSTASFCKKFKERTGMTLIQYINQKKIEQVRQLLHKEAYSLGQIAEMAGFCNENYMIRVFKKITGQTIKDYRKKDD